MRRTSRLMVAAAAGLVASAAGCGRTAPPEGSPSPAAATPPAATPPAATPPAGVGTGDSGGQSAGTLPETPSGLERFVAAVPAPPDTVGTCGTIVGAAFGEPALRGVTWTVAARGGGPERRVLLLVDSSGNPQHFSDLRGTDPRTEIAVNFAQGIGTATNFAAGKTTTRVIAPAAAVLAATSLGNGTRVARRVLTQCRSADAR